MYEHKQKEKYRKVQKKFYEGCYKCMYVATDIRMYERKSKVTVLKNLYADRDTFIHQF